MKPINQETIFITGSTDGIGKLAAISLARQGAQLIIHGRNLQKLRQVTTEIQQLTGNKNIQGFEGDFSSLEDVRKVAANVMEKHPTIDVLINNAGVGFADPRRAADGKELRFTVNYLAPFLLTRLLLPALEKAAPARIVNISSAGQSAIDLDDPMLERSFNSTKAYTQSKLALIMFTIDLAEELKNKNVTVNSLHPGTFLDTNMVRNAGIAPLGNAHIGAEAEVYLAVSTNVAGLSGKYFDGKAEASVHPQANDKVVRAKLKKLSLELTGLQQVIK